MRPLSLFLLFCLPALAGATLADQSLEDALAQSTNEGKHLYIAFLGEGWSISSKHFKTRVLDSPAFQMFAKEKLVYFPVEARRKPKLTRHETAKLQAWVIHFDVMSYPTIIVTAPDGQEVLRHTFKDIEAQKYVELLDSILP